MQKLLFSFLILFVLIGCKTGSSTSSGFSNDLDQEVKKLAKDIQKRPTEKRAIRLQEAVDAATKQDLARIERLKQSTAPDKWVQIFDVYDQMQIREIALIPVNPLVVDGKNYNLNVPNIDQETEEAKTQASADLYGEANRLLATNDRMDARKAYETLDRLIEFNFNYRDAREKRDLAKQKGSTNVFVQMNNQANRQLPDTFENDLLNFRESKFSNEWILYHHKREQAINYDYYIDLNISELVVGENQQKQRQYREEQQVIVGYRRGTDSNGNEVRIPQRAIVRADVLETLQFKPIRIAGSVVYKDDKQQELANLPVEIEEAWQNNYAEFRGDERALSQETIQKIRNGQQPYPTNEQFYEVSGGLLNQAIVQLFEQNAKNLE